MKRSIGFGLLVGVVCLLLAGSAAATEKAEQIKRDADRLSQIHKVALAPVVIQLRFDQDKRLPDPGRMAARNAVAARIPMLLQEEMKAGKYTLFEPEVMTLALKEQQWQPTDLYVTICKGNWDKPEESIVNHKKDEALLLTAREEMKKTSEEMTVFRFKWHDMPDIVYGLASFKLNAPAKIDMEKARALATKVGADAILYCQVGDMEVHSGSTLFENFKSTRIHVYMTLVAPQDGAILWQARARGVHSHKAGYFTGAGAYQAEQGMAIEGAVEAVKALMDDLYNGTGKAVKPAF